MPIKIYLSDIHYEPIPHTAESCVDRYDGFMKLFELLRAADERDIEYQLFHDRIRLAVGAKVDGYYWFKTRRTGFHRALNPRQYLRLIDIMVKEEKGKGTSITEGHSKER